MTSKTETQSRTVAQQIAAYIAGLAKTESKPETFRSELAGGVMVTLGYSNFGRRKTTYGSLPSDKRGVAYTLDKDGQHPLTGKPAKDSVVYYPAGMTFLEATKQGMGASVDDVVAACKELETTGKWRVKWSKKSGMPFRVTMLDNPNGKVTTSKVAATGELVL